MFICMSVFPFEAVSSRTVIFIFLYPWPGRVVYIIISVQYMCDLIEFMFNFFKPNDDIQMQSSVNEIEGLRIGTEWEYERELKMNS